MSDKLAQELKQVLSFITKEERNSNHKLEIQRQKLLRLLCEIEFRALKKKDQGK